MSKQANKQLKTFYDSVYRKGEKSHYTKILFNTNELPEEESKVLSAIDWNGKSVLDVGCGTGLLASLIAAKGATRVIGIDFSAEAIKEAQEEHIAENLEYKQIDVFTHQDKYDVIVSLGTLEHMDAPLEALKKFAELLNPHGTILISSPNWTNPRGYILQTLRILFDAPITLADLHYITPIEMQSWAKTLGAELTWETFDFDWAHGQRLLSDLERRLPNVLVRDMGLKEVESRIPEFLKWVEEHIVQFDNTQPWSGATGLYKLKL